MKKSLLFPFILLALLIFNPMSAQISTYKNILPGSWLGKITSGAIELRIVFNLSLAGKDSLIATMDSPDQGAKNIKLGKVTLTGGTIKISAPALIGEYNGTVRSDSTIDGTWTQGGRGIFGEQDPGTKTAVSIYFTGGDIY
jgi:hypothetical protein